MKKRTTAGEGAFLRAVAIVFALFYLALSEQGHAVTAATPVISPVSGVAFTQFDVTVTDGTPGAVINYTIDGSTPTISSPSVSSGGTILLSKSETLKVEAFADGYDPSNIATETYFVTGQIAAGESSVLALHGDGSLWSWGNYTIIPTQLTTLDGVESVDVGDYQAVALLDDSTVIMWSTGGGGGPYPSAVDGLTGITAVATGESHSLAIDGTGNLYAWGSDSSGQLGDGTTTDSYFSPITLSSLSLTTSVTAIGIAAKANYSLALGNDRNVYAWGDNSYGQLGIDPTTTSSSSSPGLISGLSGITAISAGLTHGLAIDGEGNVWAWGDNSTGQLGTDSGITPSSYTPLIVSGISDVISVSAGEGVSYAVKSDGTVWAWGDNSAGQFGNNSWTSSSTPVSVGPFMVGATPIPIVSVSAGSDYAIALGQDGSVWAWGDDYQYWGWGYGVYDLNNGILGNGTLYGSLVPVLVGNSLSTGNINAPGISLDWQWEYFGYTGIDPNADPDGDGQTNYEEYLQGTDPTISNPPPGSQLTVLSGGSTGWIGNYDLAVLFEVRATDANGSPLVNQPVVFTPDDPYCYVSPDDYSQDATVTVNTDSNGIAEVLWLIDPYNGQAIDTVYGATASCGNLSVRTTQTYTAPAPLSLSVSSGTYNSPQQVNVSVSSDLNSYSWGSPYQYPSLGAFVYYMPGEGVTYWGEPFDLRYTIDGSTPNEASPLVPLDGNITVGASETLTVAAVAPNWYWCGGSNVISQASASYDIKNPAVRLIPSNGIAPNGIVQINNTGDGDLYYTLDGTLPYPGNWNTYPVDSSNWVHVTDGQTVTVAAYYLASSYPSPVYELQYPSVAGTYHPVKIAAGPAYAMAVRTDGELLTWGGDTLRPVQVGGIGAVIDVATGDDFYLAICGDGSLWVAGDNTYGELGDGTLVASSTPKEVQGPNGWPDTVAAGTAHSLFIAQAQYFDYGYPTYPGYVDGWGDDSEGQLGDGSSGNINPTPEAVVVSSYAALTFVAARQNYSLALDWLGNIYSWGANDYGQLGNGSESGSSTPTLIGSSPAKAIAAGWTHALALIDDGTVVAWGANDSGQLGKDPVQNPSSLTPATVPGLSNVIGIAAGDEFSLAVKSDGTVWAWGYNNDGELGNNSATSSSIPVRVGPFTDPSGATVSIVAVAAGQHFAVAMGEDGSVWTWGANNSGQLGNGTTSGSLVPQMIATRLMPTPDDTNQDGISDAWEMAYFGTLDINPYADPFPGASPYNLLRYYQGGADPTNFWSRPSPSGPIFIIPALAISGGGDQKGPTDTFFSTPLQVTVQSSGGVPVPYAPVTFAVTGTSTGRLSATLGGNDGVEYLCNC